MKRRHALFGIVGFGVGLLASQGTIAQSKGKSTVIGLLDGGERLEWWAEFRKRMTELGYVEGKNVAYESRFAKSKLESLPALAQELVAREVAVIVTAATVATLAAKRATDRIPIVTVTGSDLVSMGFAASLARPGGNVTGLTSIASELTAKRLEMMREILPKMARLAVLWQADNPGSSTSFRDLEHACRASKIALQNVGVRRREEIAGAVSAAARERAEALFVINSPLMSDERRQIADLAIKHRIPTMHTGGHHVDSGGLVSYGTNFSVQFRRAAEYVDRILKGAKPGDLPIEQPTKIVMDVNLRTAKALGVAIPPSVLVRADRVID